MIYFRKFFVGILLFFGVFSNNLIAEDNIFVESYEDFKKEIELSFNSLKLIAEIGNENLSLNLWSTRNTYPDNIMKYIKVLPNNDIVTTDYLLLSIMKDTSLSNTTRKDTIKTLIREKEMTYLRFQKENDFIYTTLKKAFEEDLKGAIQEVKLHKNNRIDAKWKNNLLNKVDDLKNSVGNMETSTLDDFYNSLTTDFDRKIFNKVRQNVKSKNSFIKNISTSTITESTTFKLLNEQLNKHKIPQRLEIAGAVFDARDVYLTFIKAIDDELIAQDYLIGTTAFASVSFYLAKLFGYTKNSKLLGWLQVIEGTRIITENNVKIISLLDDQRYFSEAIKDIENKYLNPLQMQEYYTYYVNKIITDIKLDTIHAQQAIKSQNLDLMFAYLNSIESTQEFAKEMKENDTKGYLDQGAIFVGLLGLNVDVKLLKEFENIINTSHEELIVNFSKAYELESFRELNKFNDLLKEIDDYRRSEFNILLESSKGKEESLSITLPSILLTLPNGATIVGKSINSPQNSLISFQAGLTANNLRSCINNAGQEANYILQYIDINDKKRKTLSLVFDRENQIFSFNMPSSEIELESITYSGTKIGSCELPNIVKNIEDDKSIELDTSDKPIVAINKVYIDPNLVYTTGSSGSSINKKAIVEWKLSRALREESSFTTGINGFSTIVSVLPGVTTGSFYLYEKNFSWTVFTDIVNATVSKPSDNIKICKNSNELTLNDVSLGASIVSDNDFSLCEKVEDPKREYIVKDEAIIDILNKLMWQDVPKNKVYTKYADATSYCNNIDTEGFDDWRVPTISELVSLKEDKKNSNNLYMSDNFRNYALSKYWSSTLDEAWGSNIYMKGMDFSDGYGAKLAAKEYRMGSTSFRSYYIRCVRDIEESELPNDIVSSNNNLFLLQETYLDGTNISTLFTKEWRFNQDLNNITIDIVENSYQNAIVRNDLIIDGKTLKVNLTPDTTRAINKLVLQFKDENGNIVKVSGSETFWSLTKTNHAPRLADGQITNLVGDSSSYLDIETYDSDGDSVILSVEDNAGGTITLDGNRLSASFNDGKVAHTIKIGLSDGKEKVIKEFSIIDFSQNSIEDFYSDVDKNSDSFDAIAFATLKGVVGGQIDPNDATKRIFRPNDNVSLAEALAMIINAEQKAGWIQLTTSDYYMEIYPSWAMKYYTFAREKGALGREISNLASIYPTKEQIAKLIVKTLDLDSRVYYIDKNISFDDESDFSDAEMLFYGKVAKAFGLFMRDNHANPQAHISRADLAMVIEKIFMIPRASLNITPSSVEFGEHVSASLVDAKAEGIDHSTYKLIDTSSQLQVTYVANDITLSNPIDTAVIPERLNTLYAILDNSGVKNITTTDIHIIFTDSDSDGRQDKDDKWLNDTRYSYDDNSNGIPDILDMIYGLSAYSSIDSITIDGKNMPINDIINDGGVNITSSVGEPNNNTQTITKTLSLKKGWNLIGIESNMELETFKSKVGESNLLVIQGQEKTYQKRYINSSEENLNDFEVFENGKGYWLKVENDITIEYLVDNSTENEILLQSGWSLINPLENIDINTIKNKLGESNIEFIQGEVATYQKRYLDSHLEFLNDFNGFEEDKGYWIKLKEDVTL